MKKERRPHGYWNVYENCKKEALKYKTRKEFRQKSQHAYRKILKNNWLVLINHMNVLLKKEKYRLIYVYEFSDNHCYVGLTCDIENRDKRHRDFDSPVHQHFLKSNIIPLLKTKTKYLPEKEAINMEEKMLNKYKENGWNILNRTKTGSLGATNNVWDKNSCLKAALKYNKIIDFQHNESGACNSSRKNGWFGEITKHMKRCKSLDYYWNNKELCKQESIKYNNRSSFKKNCWGAYHFSRINGWLDEFYLKYKRLN